MIKKYKFVLLRHCKPFSQSLFVVIILLCRIKVAKVDGKRYILSCSSQEKEIINNYSDFIKSLLHQDGACYSLNNPSCVKEYPGPSQALGYLDVRITNPKSQPLYQLMTAYDLDDSRPKYQNSLLEQYVDCDFGADLDSENEDDEDTSCNSNRRDEEYYGYYVDEHAGKVIVNDIEYDSDDVIEGEDGLIPVDQFPACWSD